MTRNQEKQIKQMVDKWLETKGGSIEEREHRSAAWMKYFNELKVPKPVYLLAAATWLCSGAVILPEDMPKVEQAVKVAEINKVDPLRYGRPMAIIDAFPSTELREAPIDPNTVPTLHLERKFDSGLAIYNVDESQESRENMRKIINTHFGKDSSPWCLLQGDGQGNLIENSKEYWDYYSAVTKQVAFFEGKLVAFSAMEDPGQVSWWDREDAVEDENVDEAVRKENFEKHRPWWDRQDNPHENIMVKGKIKEDTMGRFADMHIDPNTGEVSYKNIFRYGHGGWGKECYQSLEDTTPVEIKPQANPKSTFISLPDNLTEIDAQAFAGCMSLQEVRIPKGVTEIGGSAFCECLSLREVHIPEGVTKINHFTFGGCSSLREVHIPAGVTEISRNAFLGCTSLRKIHIPAGVTKIAAGAFSGCSSLQEFRIPDGVTEIRNCAFKDCSSLQKIHIPDSVKEINWGTFHGCSSLREIHIPDSVTKINDGAFAGCTSLREIYIPEGVVEIGAYAFEGCASLQEIHIPEGVTEIAGHAFSGCKSLQEIRIPDGVTAIGYDAFWSCTSLQKIHIPDSVTRICAEAFNNCISLQEIHIPEGVTEIGVDAFKGCTALREVRVSATAPLSLVEHLKECIPQQCVIIYGQPKIYETELAVLKEYGVSDKAIKTLQENGSVHIKDNTFPRKNTETSPCPEFLKTVKTDILVVNKEGRLWVKTPDGTGNLGAVSSFFEKFKKRSGFIPKKPVAAAQEVKTLKIK